MDEIMRYNRQPVLSEFFEIRLKELISYGMYPNNVAEMSRKLISSLVQYKTLNDIDTVFVGMSGGIDSALTASLFKAAGWKVNGVVMPINQKPEETDRGVEACESLGITQHFVDLTPAYENMIQFYQNNGIDEFTATSDINAKKRAGNIRARLRMMTLYNKASYYGGLVASTDNFSELAAGFWTLHGDVGDVAPIQSLSKSWEVPAMAEYMGVPDSIIEAVPTDGLGITDKDEDQFGFSYLQFDIALFSLLQNFNCIAPTDSDQKIMDSVKERISNTTYKRANPLNLPHPLYNDRFENLQSLDSNLRR
jgi:nicotinamide-nucleotide amidase